MENTLIININGDQEWPNGALRFMAQNWQYFGRIYKLRLLFLIFGPVIKYEPIKILKAIWDGASKSNIHITVNGWEIK